MLVNITEHAFISYHAHLRSTISFYIKELYSVVHGIFGSLISRLYNIQTNGSKESDNKFSRLFICLPCWCVVCGVIILLVHYVIIKIMMYKIVQMTNFN
jgi:hypothetical protein